MPARVVALPMYEVPAAALHAFWAGLRRALVASGIAGVPPEMSNHPEASAHWRDPGLLLGQACGYPLVTELAGRVNYVGTPCYAAEGCDGPRYSSVVVVRFDDRAEGLEDLRGRRAVINHTGSHSGWNALRALVAPLARGGRFFESVRASGSHHDSMRQVGAGEAEVAAIDCVTFALARRNRPALTAPLRVIARTASVPGLPFITSGASSDDDLVRIRTALDSVFADPSLAEARRAMLLAGWRALDLADYRVILRMEAAAAEAGYPALA